MTNDSIISLSELSTMAILAFQNGLRLHFDSSILLENKSYPSSILLSVLSMEEFGKYFSLSAYVFYTGVNDTRDLKLEDEYLKGLFNHINKQRSIFGRDGFDPSMEGILRVENRFYESLKQRSAYVGYDRFKGTILYDKGINNPFDVEKGNAIQQFDFMNDSLIELVENQMKGIIGMDEDEVNDLLNEDLLTYLNELKEIKKSL